MTVKRKQIGVKLDPKLIARMNAAKIKSRSDPYSRLTATRIIERGIELALKELENAKRSTR